jgi:hypothetical protein
MPQPVWRQLKVQRFCCATVSADVQYDSLRSRAKGCQLGFEFLQALHGIVPTPLEVAAMERLAGSTAS